VQEEILEDYDPLGWHTISGVHFLELLWRAHRGENPETIYNEACDAATVQDYSAE
jgi:hypothetical protein